MTQCRSDRLCTRCRCHRSTDGGRLLKAGSNQTRWVCAPCLGIIREHKRRMGGGRD